MVVNVLGGLSIGCAIQAWHVLSDQATLVQALLQLLLNSLLLLQHGPDREKNEKAWSNANQSPSWALRRSSASCVFKAASALCSARLSRSSASLSFEREMNASHPTSFHAAYMPHTQYHIHPMVPYDVGICDVVGHRFCNSLLVCKKTPPWFPWSYPYNFSSAICTKSIHRWPLFHNLSYLR